MAFQTVIARSDRPLDARVINTIAGVDWLGPFPATAKLAPELRPAASREPSAVGRRLVAATWPGESTVALADAIAAAGGAVGDVTPRAVMFEGSAELAGALARLDAVAWLQENAPAEAFNTDVQWLMQVGWQPEPPDITSGRPVWQRGLRGQNVIVGLFDTGIRTDHDLFVQPVGPLPGPGVYRWHRKIIAYKLYGRSAFGDEGSASYHGTAVAGALAGNDSAAGNRKRLEGIAPDARIYFVDNYGPIGGYQFDPDVTALLDTVRLARGLNEPVYSASGSFGSTVSPGTYRLEEATLDAVCWGDKSFLLVWAAGNLGTGSHRIGHPACAKSALTVGACGNGIAGNTVASFSSRGPTTDGRIKPEILAPGDGVVTAYGRNTWEYRRRSGTSYSAPVASGALALVRQYFAEGWFPSGRPDSAARRLRLSSALFRALAVTGADSNVGSDWVPNAAAGWGRLDLGGLLCFPGDTAAFTFIDDTNGLEGGSSIDFEFNLAARGRVRVVLAWTDTAASPAAAIAIVNDLDLQLVAPDGNRYAGNQFTEGQSRANPPLSDERNTIEVCQIDRPLAGRWTATVRARSVFTARQPFALVIQGGLEGMASVAEPRRDGERGAVRRPMGTTRLRLGALERLEVFAIDGRRVATASGPREWSSTDDAGRPLAAGVYCYRIVGGVRPPQTGRVIVSR